MDLSKNADKFGPIVTEVAKKDPLKARKLISMSCTVNVMAQHIPSKYMSSSRRYGEQIVTGALGYSILHPEDAAMVSIFMPCEPLAVAGVTPLSIEAFSGLASGMHCEQFMLDKTKEDGEPETLCSFHRVFHGAMSTGVMSPPKMLLYTNLACDANMIAFPYIIDRYKIPNFFVEVPFERTDEAVKYVAEQLKEMVKFISDISGKSISEEGLREAVERGKRTTRNYLESLKYVGQHALKGPTDSEMYGIYSNHIMMGTKEAENYSIKVLKEIKKVPNNDAVRLLWMHMIPYVLPSINNILGYSEKARITAIDLIYDSAFDVDIADPYEAMAYRMVHSLYNGDSKYRAERAIEIAKMTDTEGIVLFEHWGCKSTFGAAGLYEKIFKEAGIPFLVLNGDGGDPSNCADGQIATRFGAFLEMLLENRKNR